MVTLYVGYRLLTEVTPSEIAYDRSRFGGWQDKDGDCLDTRSEILAMSSSSAVELDGTGCRVIGGYWVDVYSGEPITEASSIDIDHLVSLSHAWAGGASSWSDQDRAIFANDLENLIITSASLNRSKNSSSPLQWLPPNDEFQCDFVERFIMVSKKYDITMQSDEQERLLQLQSSLCD